MPPKARLLAHYLPQFHPTPENDTFWGPGFSEWTQVAAARPLFRGHRQPVLPGELGFYDLRLGETRDHQAELALVHGIEGFVYWHYWFDGRRALDRPFADVLRSGEPDFPFCVAWANHSWTRVWGGNSGTILLEQTYPGADDHRRHFAALEAAFHDPRHVRVGGRPLFYLFEPRSIPDLAATLELWQELALASGLEGLWIVGRVEGYWAGPDAARVASLLDGVTDYSLGYLEAPTTKRWDRLRRRPGPHRLPYTSAIEAIPRLVDGHHSYPTVLTGWDATPRHGRRSTVLVDRRPEHLAAMVTRAIELVADRPLDDRLVFVKSWNEWSEGNYLEPDRDTGRAYLEAVRRANSAETEP